MLLTIALPFIWCHYLGKKALSLHVLELRVRTDSFATASGEKLGRHTKEKRKKNVEEKTEREK